MNMKLVLLASAAALIATSSANAADAIVYQEPAPVAIDAFSWTGGYVGVNAGYGFGKMKQGGESLKPRGFVGGVQAGYNWQFDNNVVAGIEADFQGSAMKKKITFYDGAGAYEGDVKAKVQWFGTVRGRLGAEIAERTMLYGTAGLAYAEVKLSGNSDWVGPLSDSKTRAGWTIGAGVEHAFTDNVSLKAEYLYADLGKVRFSDTVADEKIKVNFNTVRAGLNYKF